MYALCPLTVIRSMVFRILSEPKHFLLFSFFIAWIIFIRLFCFSSLSLLVMTGFFTFLFCNVLFLCPFWIFFGSYTGLIHLLHVLSFWLSLWLGFCLKNVLYIRMSNIRLSFSLISTLYLYWHWLSHTFCWIFPHYFGFSLFNCGTDFPLAYHTIPIPSSILFLSGMHFGIPFLFIFSLVQLLSRGCFFLWICLFWF